MATTSDSPESAAKSFRMIDVGGKAITQRRALAQGSIVLSADAFVALRDGKNPKGNVLALAEIAGIQAAKKTPDLIPLCHPLPLNSVSLEFTLNQAERSVTVVCEARAEAKTGVEMEALAGVSGALLTIYDLSKAVSPEITISEIRLKRKEGGKTGVWTHPDETDAAVAPATPTQTLAGVSACVLTVSDSVSQRQSEDRSGPELVNLLQTLGCEVNFLGAVADDIAAIQHAVMAAVESHPRLLFTTGGTGLSPRDVTPEALEKLCSRKIEGFGELLRQNGARHIATAWLSRSFAGMIRKTLVVALPGSPKAVREGVEVVSPLLPHALKTIDGARHSKNDGEKNV